jgi:tRNA G18 (ribose-2'-O)-methylase SpoU
MAEKIVVLDNIRSAHNVGSIFRTSDGAGVVHIYVCGYTPTPIDRFGRTVAEIKKTSLGASESMPWTAVPDADVAALAVRLKTEGYAIVAVEQAEGSRSLYDFSIPEKVVYVLGNEIDGVSPAWQNAADVVVEIPMRGMKESLNVSVCAGIMLFRG